MYESPIASEIVVTLNTSESEPEVAVAVLTRPDFDRRHGFPLSLSHRFELLCISSSANLAR